MNGKEVLENEVIKEIADAHGKTPAQVILRWHLQYDNIVIPKSVTPSRIAENFNLFDFELSNDDMKKIEGLNKNHRSGADPAEFHVK